MEKREFLLSELFDMNMGKTPSRDERQYWVDGEYPWISIADMSENGKFIVTTKEKITAKAIQETGIKPIYPGTVIMSFKLSVGKVARTTVKSYSNEAIMAFEIKDNEPSRYTISNDYAYYLLSSLNFENVGNKAVMGKTLNKGILLNTSVYVHPWSEQLRIIAILDKINSLIEKRREQLDKLDELVKARFVEMFGDPVDNEMGWLKEPLEKVCNTIVDCPHSTPTYTNENTGYMCIRTSIVKKNQILWDDIEYIPENEYFQRIQRKRPEVGDIVYTREGAILGIAAMIDQDCNVALGQRSMLLSPNTERCLSRFLCVAMNFDSFLRKALEGISGSASPHINVGDIKEFHIIVPPITLQKQFSDFVEQNDLLSKRVKQSLEKLETFKKALMQKYFG